MFTAANCGMRTAITFLFGALLTSCSQAQPDIDRIEMRRSGESSLDISLDRQGDGRFRINAYPASSRDGTFALKPEQVDRLIERLKPFRTQAVVRDEASLKRFIHGTCPAGTPVVTDAGAIYIRWIGSNSDWHYLAELGCERDRHKARNDELRSILSSFPIPD